MFANNGDEGLSELIGLIGPSAEGDNRPFLKKSRSVTLGVIRGVKAGGLWRGGVPFCFITAAS